MDKVLGFIGMGLMGRPMTLRLLQSGFQVHVWNRTPRKITDVVDAGANACATVEVLISRSDVILLCLADSQVVTEIVDNHVLNAGAPGKLLIDLSSIDPDTTCRLASKLKQQCGMSWVDAPVSGGTAGAEQGSLAIMAGGADEDIAVAREVLKPLYRQLIHMGGTGCGQVAKICNQMIVSCNVMVIAEMMALAKQTGVDAEKIPQALAGGFADSKPLQIVAPEMANDIFEPVKWRIKTLLKDLRMAESLAEKYQNEIPVSSLTADLLQKHGELGFMEQDPATLIKLFSKK